MKYLSILLLLFSTSAFAMNRYDIVDIKSGKITHSYKDTAPHPHNIGWGKLERWVWGRDLSESEKADALSSEDVVIKPCPPEPSPSPSPSPDPSASPGPSPSPTPVCTPVVAKRYRMPQTYRVDVIDLTADLAEEAAKEQKAITRRAVLIACAKLDSTATAAQIRTCTIANSRELVRQYLLSTEQ
jgi:hypothetical protein